MAVYDVVAVGAGPAGSRAAYASAKLGLKTCLIEEHTQAGKPSHCAGKLYAKAFKEFSLPHDAIINKVRGAFIYSPSNIVLAVSKSETDSYIIEREIFDLQLSDMACDAGSVLLTNTKCYDIQRNNDKTYSIRVKRKSFSEELKAKIVVDAEGWNPILAGKFLSQRSKVYLEGAQYEMENVSFEEADHVELFFGSRFFPGFFGWIIPLGKGKARVGLCVRKEKVNRSAFSYLNDAIRSHPAISMKTRGAKILKASGGYIPIHGPLNKTYNEGFLTVGDAAGHTKSTTGGGIYFGLKAGEIAGKIAAEHLTAESNSYCLKVYQSECQKAFGNELKFTSSVRKVLDQLSDDSVDEIIRIFNADEDLKRKIILYGDTAYQSRLVGPVTSRLGKLTVRKPSIIVLFIKAMLGI